MVPTPIGPEPHSIVFNREGGTCQIDGFELVICDRLAKADAINALGDFITSNRDYGNGYEWLYLHQVSFDGKKAWLSLCFFKNELEMLLISVSLPDDTELDNWPTEETSLRQVAYMRKVLEKQLSCSMKIGHHEFSWGSAWSNFDIKGYQASGGLRYVRAKISAATN